MYLLHSGSTLLLQCLYILLCYLFMYAIASRYKKLFTPSVCRDIVGLRASKEDIRGVTSHIAHCTCRLEKINVGQVEKEAWI
jgi:hypothetical protein